MIRELALGAVRGTVATVAMSVPIVLAPDSVMGRRPPKKVTVGVLRRVGLDPGGEGERNAVSLLAHFGYGAGMGSIFTAAREQFHPPGPAVLQGAAYGLAIWALNYKGWIPAVGILPDPEHDRPGRQGVMILAHVVYGGVLGALHR